MRNKRSIPNTTALVLTTVLIAVGCSTTSEPNTPTNSSTGATQTSTEDTANIQAPTGLFRALTELPPAVSKVDDVSGELLLPLGKIVLTKTATATTLAPISDDLPSDVNWESESTVVPNLVPSDGEEFVIFELRHDYSAITDKLSLALELNGQEEVIELAPNKTTIFVKAVTPEDKENLNLIARYDGATQKINLLTRERLSTGTAELYYAPDSKVAIFDNGQTVRGEIPAFDGGIITASTDLQAERQSYVEGLGWADGGTSDWLLITYATFPYWQYVGESYIVDTSETTLQWTLKDTAGTQYVETPQDSSTLVFKVPADVKDFEISFSMTGEVWKDSSTNTPASIDSFPLLLRFQ